MTPRPYPDAPKNPVAELLNPAVELGTNAELRLKGYKSFL